MQRLINTFSLAAFCSATVLLTSCGNSGNDAAANAMQMPPTQVTIANPVQKNITEWDEYTGRLDASQSVNLYSQVTGYLESIHFRDGSEVKKGDLLFQIDPRPFQAVLDQATAQLEQARIKLELTKNEFERAKKLVDAKAISAEDYDTRAKAVAEAQAGLKVSQAMVDKAKLDVDYTKITAPIDGRIGRKLMDEGGLVIGGPMGATLLTSIVNLDPIYCYIDADELSVLRYQKLNREGKGSGQEDRIPCEIALADSEGFPFKAVIDFVDNRLDTNTGTIQVRAVLDNPRPERGQRILQPGYFTRVRVPSGLAYDALLVDDKAIGTDQSTKVVMVVGEGNIVVPKPVTVGPLVEGLRVVRTGLTAEDKVIVNGIAKVRPGMPVAPLTVEEATKAAAAAQGAQTAQAHK